MNLFGSRDSTDEKESTENTDVQTTATGEAYDIEETGIERVGGVEAISETENEGLVAGPAVRDILEEGTENPEKDLWVGYTEDPQEGFREAGIPFGSLSQHIWVAGVSGAGKTTELLNWMVQLAYSDHGFVYFDPKGKDSRELLRKLPENRLDDVVWIEPGTERDREIGLNLLDVPDTDSEVELETAIENRLESLKASLAAKGELHATMESTTESMGRAMMKANDDPDAPNYGLIDFYFTLLKQERRESFAQECQDKYIREFLEEIAEMDTEKHRPLLKRVKAWVENGVVRRIIARRESTVSWRDLIDNDRIIIVRTPVESTDVKRLTTLAVMRGIWSAIQNRSYETMDTPDPFFVFADEFDDIASEQLDIKSMLARARSMNLSVTAAVQYPSQLTEEVLKPIKNNADNLVTFTANDHDDARILSDRFRDYGPDDIIQTEQYKVWTRLPTGGGEYSQPLKLSTFAPYPPLRGKDAVEDIIMDSLEKYGDEPLTDAQIQRELPYGDLDETELEGSDSEDIEFTDEIEGLICKAAYDEALQRGIEDGFAPADDVGDRIREYVDADVEHSSRLWDLVDQVPADKLETKTEDGEAYVRCTPAGKTAIVTTGSAASGGSVKHRELLKDLYDPFVRIGARVRLPEQDGTDMPDAVAGLEDVEAMGDLPSVDELAGMSIRKRTRIERSVYDSFEAENPLLYQLSEGAEIAIEAESSTGESKPAQTWLNLVQAANFGQRCLFSCREDVAPNVWRTLTENDHYSHRWDGDHERYYNSGNLSIGGEHVYRPATGRETVWLHDQDSDEIVLRDSAGNEHARFPDVESVFSAVSHYPATESDIEDSDEWTPIKKPFIPEWELHEAASIEPTEWDIIIIPNDPVDETDLEIYEGETRPLTMLVDQEGQEGQDVQTDQDDRDGIDISDLRLSTDD